MLIKLTGLDTAGKSSTAELLGQHGFASIYNPPTPPGVDLLDHYRRKLDEARGRDVVWDRGFVTEHIYGPVMRTSSRLTDPQFLALGRQLARSPGFVVHIWEPACVLARRLEDSSRDQPPHAAIRQVLPDLELRQEAVLVALADVAEVVRYRPSTDTLDVILDAASRLDSAQ